MQKSNVSVCIVLFKPEKEHIENIENVKKIFSDVYVYDNTKENLGLAKRYNQALKKAFEENKKYLFLLDQDSFIEKNEFEKFLDCANKIKDGETILLSLSLKKTDLNGCVYEYNTFPVSSGTLIDVEKALKIGGFIESFFIDEIDHEFVLRAMEHGYKTVNVLNASFKHSIGEKKRFLFFKYSCYRKERYYYMLRNFLFLKKMYRHGFIEKRKKYLIKFFVKSVFFCRDRIGIIKMLIKAYKDYKKNVLGKQVEIG